MKHHNVVPVQQRAPQAYTLVARGYCSEILWA
jgi:hypothetical protein